MRRLLITILPIALLAACSAPTPPEGQAADAAAGTEKPTVQAEAGGAPAAAFNPAFPEGIAPDFRHKIRSRKDEKSGSETMRKLVIEFKEGDAATIDAKMQSLLEGKGYRRYKTLQTGQDLVGDYGKPGHRVRVTTTPVGENLKLDPDSLGTVYLVWTE